MYRSEFHISTEGSVMGGLFLLLMGVASVVGMITHIIICVQTNWAAMLIIGLVVPPVGVVHGLGSIFGFW